MKRKQTAILIGALLFAGLIAVAALGTGIVEGETDCEEIYNKSVETGSADNIRSECKPIPETVENRILMQALGG